MTLKNGITIGDTIYRYADRDIILVTMVEADRLQPMYRSSGKNSAMPGTWLPFDGISCNGRWFNKRRYVTPQVPTEFERFGNQELKDLSRALGEVDIPVGKVASWQVINEFLEFKEEEQNEPLSYLWKPSNG